MHGSIFTILNPYFKDRLWALSSSQGLPPKCTTAITSGILLALAIFNFSKIMGQIFSVSGLISTKSISAPKLRAAFAVATKVIGDVQTILPDRMLFNWKLIVKQRWHY